MTCKYFLIVVNKLKKTVSRFEPTDTGLWGQRSTYYATTDSNSHSKCQSNYNRNVIYLHWIWTYNFFEVLSYRVPLHVVGSYYEAKMYVNIYAVIEKIIHSFFVYHDHSKYSQKSSMDKLEYL